MSWRRRIAAHISAMCRTRITIVQAARSIWAFDSLQAIRKALHRRILWCSRQRRRCARKTTWYLTARAMEIQSRRLRGFATASTLILSKFCARSTRCWGISNFEEGDEREIFHLFELYKRFFEFIEREMAGKWKIFSFASSLSLLTGKIRESVLTFCLLHNPPLQWLGFPLPSDWHRLTADLIGARCRRGRLSVPGEQLCRFTWRDSHAQRATAAKVHRCTARPASVGERRTGAAMWDRGQAKAERTVAEEWRSN